jgi:hypothetical protein
MSIKMSTSPSSEIVSWAGCGTGLDRDALAIVRKTPGAIVVLGSDVEVHDEQSEPAVELRVLLLTVE